jgi:hypothetical protein
VIVGGAVAKTAAQRPGFSVNRLVGRRIRLRGEVLFLLHTAEIKKAADDDDDHQNSENRALSLTYGIGQEVHIMLGEIFPGGAIEHAIACGAARNCVYVLRSSFVFALIKSCSVNMN